MQRGPQDRAPGGSWLVPGFDTTVANPARVWNYWVGGKDNFAVDREVGRKVLELLPFMPMIARYARRFLVDAVRQLSADCGIRQFLDIGTGLPTADNTHEVAQRAAPESRVVYVDNDPVVLAHARALLTSSPEGKTGYIAADLREPGTILAGAGDILDFREPVAVLLVAVLHFVPDTDDPYGLVARLMDAGTTKCHWLCQVREERLLCIRSVSVDSFSGFLHCCARRYPPKGSRSSIRRCRPVCDSIPPAKRLNSAACRSISYSPLKKTEPWSCSAAGASRAFRSSI